MKKITIERVKEVVDDTLETDLVTVKSHIIVTDKDEHKTNNWVLLCLNEGRASLHPMMLLNEVYAEDEMVLGISSATKGRVMQLGPYDDALVVQEGVDVTHLFTQNNLIN